MRYFLNFKWRTKLRSDLGENVKLSSLFGDQIWDSQSIHFEFPLSNGFNQHDDVITISWQFTEYIVVHTMYKGFRYTLTYAQTVYQATSWLGPLNCRQITFFEQESLSGRRSWSSIALDASSMMKTCRIWCKETNSHNYT